MSACCAPPQAVVPALPRCQFVVPAVLPAKGAFAAAQKCAVPESASTFEGDLTFRRSCVREAPPSQMQEQKKRILQRAATR